MAAVALAGATWWRVAHERLDLLTFVVLLGTLVLVAWDIAALLASERRRRLGAAVSIVATATMLLGGELVLRQRGTYATYLERNEGRSYELQYHHTGRARYLVYPPNSSYTHPRAEFAFPRTTNSLGLPDAEVPREKRPNEFRILALGDSYTEGVGTSADRTWLKVVEARAAAAMPDRVVSSINAGVSGSDAWYSLVLLQDRLLTIEPDLVLLAINASDLNDVIIRGGFERFQDDGTTKPRPTPWWEWLYGVSFLARHVVHDALGYNALFVLESQWQEARREAGVSLLRAIREFQTFSRNRGLRLVVVFHPDTREASRQRYERGFAAFVDEAKRVSGVQVVDVLEHWVAQHRLDGGGAGALYWPVDGHNTPDGYAALGAVVADSLFPPVPAVIEDRPR